ncbi:MAG TPA: hypothetical protein VMG38_11750 [Trebonia sp.]|nr:hypothetical protein [Trebonia sp.]
MAPPQAAGARQQRPSHLRLIADHGRLVHPVFESSADRADGRPVLNEGNGQPGRREAGAGPVRADRERQAARRTRPAGPRPGQPGGQGRLRLTRRGRLAITSTVVVLIAVLSMVLASTAEAAIHL